MAEKSISDTSGENVITQITNMLVEQHPSQQKHKIGRTATALTVELNAPLSAYKKIRPKDSDTIYT